MLFQVLDDKSECIGIYCNGQLYFDKNDFPDGLNQTWKYSSSLRGKPNIEFATLYLEGHPPGEFLPEYLQDDWQDVKEKLQAFTRSLKIAQVDMGENCIYDLTPTRFLKEFGAIRDKMTQHILTSHPRPVRYDYMLKVSELLGSIADIPLKINHRRLNSLGSSPAEKQTLTRLRDARPYIIYNQFGTRTGRLTTEKNSFPILTMKREHRQIIEPHKDTFIELDFNGAEARTMVGLAGMEQPPIDVHDFHAREIFNDEFTREQAKTAFFAWLYGSRSTPKNHREKLSAFYNRDIILEKYWDGTTVTTPYKKTIKDVDKHHALNYIIQSTTAELTLLQALKIDHYLRLKDCRSRIACVIHDAIVIDFSKEDEVHLPSLQQLMSSTTFGNYVINRSRGATLGSLKREKI